jgi:hypothetical protein
MVEPCRRESDSQQAAYDDGSWKADMLVQSFHDHADAISQSEAGKAFHETLIELLGSSSDAEFSEQGRKRLQGFLCRLSEILWNLIHAEVRSADNVIRLGVATRKGK